MTYSDYVKGIKNKDLDFFFGEANWKRDSNQYVYYQSILDEDNIIIRTNNIKWIKGQPVLLIDNDMGVYLKDWQVKDSGNYWEDIEFSLVKLNRKYFRPYQFSFKFDGMEFIEQDTFESLVELAKEQQQINLKVKI